MRGTVVHMSGWTTDRMPDLSERVFVVTGATSGLGLATSRALAARGARVVMAVRDVEKARRLVPGATAHHLDLADLASVRAFAGRLHDEHDHLDVLINNAGTMAPRRLTSAQGHELQFATNHLGHFALTGHLLDLLLAGHDPRVVTVTSVNHRRAGLPFEEHRFTPMGVYNRSKLANAIFGYELHRRVDGLRSVLAHPGYTVTGFQSAASTPLVWRVLLGWFGNPLIAQPVERGVLPQLYAATEPEVPSGALVVPGGPGEMRGHPVLGKLSAAATDPANGRRLWELSERLTEVHVG